MKNIRIVERRYNWSPKAFSIAMGLFLSFSLLSAQESGIFYGNSKRSVVCVQLSDSVAYAEYSYTDMRGNYHSKFDTLKQNKNKYIGRFSQIAIESDRMLFKPGKIALSHQKPDNSFNKIRNSGYLEMTNSKLQMALLWTEASLNDFNAAKWKGEEMMALQPEDYKQKIDHTYDSLYNYYSNTYAQRFDKVIIKNYRLFPKKYVESTDTAEIHKIWKKLSSGIPTKRSLTPYIIQFPLMILLPAAAGFDFNYAMLGAAFSYPALIYAEKFIGNRLTAGSTYSIQFLSSQNKKSTCTVKIRKSKIRTNEYLYTLPFNFEATLLNKPSSKP